MPGGCFELKAFTVQFLLPSEPPQHTVFFIRGYYSTVTFEKQFLKKKKSTNWIIPLYWIEILNQPFH